ncbi:uncharacterized protein V6R79_007357 [Siganus canaliculatus]
MAVLTSTLIFSLWTICSASSGIQITETDLGKDVVLDCTGPSSNINLVVWVRADLGPEEYVFFRNGKISISKQLPSYRGRVSLQDPDMKNGNVSVLLKNVTISDIGLYECLVRETNTGRRKRAAEPQSRTKIRLTLRSQDSVSGEHSETGSAGPTDGGSPAGLRGHLGLLVAAAVMAAAVVFTVSGVVWKLSTKKRAEQPAADGEEENLNITGKSVECPT